MDCASSQRRAAVFYRTAASARVPHKYNITRFHLPHKSTKVFRLNFLAGRGGASTVFAPTGSVTLGWVDVHGDHLTLYIPHTLHLRTFIRGGVPLYTRGASTRLPVTVVERTYTNPACTPPGAIKCSRDGHAREDGQDAGTRQGTRRRIPA